MVNVMEKTLDSLFHFLQFLVTVLLMEYRKVEAYGWVLLDWEWRLRVEFSETVVL